MAEDKNKPKATLIKHKKDESPRTDRPDDSQDKRKVRVVVKKKPTAKYVVKKESAEKPAAQQAPRKKATPAPEEPKETAQETPVAEAQTTAEKPTTETGAKEAAQKAAPEKKEAPAARSRPEAESAAESPGKEKEAERSKSGETAAEKPAAAAGAEPQSKAEPEKRPVWTPEGTRVSRPAGARSGQGSIPQSIRERARAGEDVGVRRAGRTDRDTSGGYRGSSRPSDSGPRTFRPSGPGTRPSGPRPGGFRPGPPRPGAPRPATEGGTSEDKKGGAKKFYKAKKKESYPKKEKHQEKFIQVKQKKSAPKANPVPKQIDIMEVITVSELARKMNLKASDLIGKLMGMGMMVTINQQIDAETAAILANEYDCKVNIVSLYDETLIDTPEDKEEDLEPRPPIVTVMGHVDHGKTKLLDAIRSTDVAGGEFGGITQHIGAYQVQLPQGKITFLDTPGHEAFTLMRARGAQITDIVILVVAANDGVMPQTIEAINHAKEAKVPIVVAINKIDLPEANPDRVKQQLSDHGLMPEAWGGQTLFCEISALKKQGISELLETVLLQAEILELRANFGCAAEGKIIESRIDPGRGTVATVLIERGTLHIGDSYVAGVFPGKVRAMFNDRGDRVEEAGPSMPIEVLGFTGVPDAGDPFQVTESEKLARQIGDKRQELRKVEEAKNVKKITLDNLYDSIQEGEVQELKVIIKGDVHGSVEALQSSLERLSTKEIRLSVIHAAAGAINEGDVRLASASNAIIVGFHVRPSTAAQQMADREKVEIRKYNIIYDVVEDIRAAMEGLLAPELKEEVIGTAEVRETFKVPKIGVIAGSYVTDGKVKRGASVRVIRDGIEIYSGAISSLKRFKDDAREVETGYECGIGVENYNDLKVGDQFEVYEVREIAKKLEETRAQSGGGE
ncbi:translation initiation factor IF-2 [Salinispira pacifica]